MQQTIDDRPLILAVDDTPTNLALLTAVLSGDYRIATAPDGTTALAIALGETPPDLILLDITMPGIDGYEVCRQLKADPRTAPVPVIFVTALNELHDEEYGFACGGSDYLIKPVHASIVKARVRTHVELYLQKRYLEQKVHERTQEIQETRLEIIHRLGKAAERADNDTGEHITRMSRYSRIIAKELALPDDLVDLIFNIAPMHDIGKIGIPHEILSKPAKLDKEEWAIMQTHTTIGADILSGHDSLLLRGAADIALTHHEKWDGTGYPNRLSKEKIHLPGRIVAIADVFDALTSKRPYKNAWTVDAAIEHIRSESEKHFDPECVAAFLRAQDAIIAVRAAFAD